MPAPIKSFAALAAAMQRNDVERAKRLRKTANLPARKPGTGPRKAS